MKEFDVCIIGSGAGAGPIAYELSKAGYHVVVLEKGKWFQENDFSKDEIEVCRRDAYTPNLKEEFHLIEDQNEESDWVTENSSDYGLSFWNGNCVGGSSNFMSAYFHRLKPIDFRLLSEFGPIAGANIVDWPICYDDLEPYYQKTETVVGISGKVVDHPHLEPRSTNDFPFPPLAENYAVQLFDQAASGLGYHPFPVARGILSKPQGKRGACYYSDYCGSYGCSSGAKGSSRAALLDTAVATGNCVIRAESQVYRLETDSSKTVSCALYRNKDGEPESVSAKIFVVACQAIESARLLFLSANVHHPNGLGNRYEQLGKNLVFSAGATGGAEFHLRDYPAEISRQLKQPGLFINRALQDWYVFETEALGRVKGGTIDFTFEHANPIRRAMSLKWDGSRLLWGKDLKRALERDFQGKRHFRFEVFNDWLPTDDCFVSLGSERDKWGNAVAKVRVGYHKHDLQIAEYLGDKATTVLTAMNLHEVYSSVSSSPPSNLLAGGCRFGNNPRTSYLDRDCRVHSIDNVYVSDGSFMPTGGSVPFTWTIYANSFRVADAILRAI